MRERLFVHPTQPGCLDDVPVTQQPYVLMAKFKGARRRIGTRRRGTWALWFKRNWVLVALGFLAFVGVARGGAADRLGARRGVGRVRCRTW